MHKILQDRLQEYMNWEFTHVQAEFRKGTTRDQIANMCWIIEKKARESQKNIFFIDFTQAFDCGL